MGLVLPASVHLSDAAEAAMTDLYRRGTSAGTLRAWECDLASIAMAAAFPRPWNADGRVATQAPLRHL